MNTPTHNALAASNKCGLIRPRFACLFLHLPLITLLLAIRLAAQPSQSATETGPKVGEAAPEIRVSEWIKGVPISGFEKGNIYVLEFWATWCGPCLTAIPHLSEVQRRFKDKGVTIIGVNVMEHDLGKAMKQIKKIAASADYSVAIGQHDAGEKAGFMEQAWLGDDRSIPRCLIVDRDTKIAWIGHPLSVDGPLQAMVQGTFNAAEQAETDRKYDELDNRGGEALRAKRWQEVLVTLDQMHAVNPLLTPFNYPARVEALIGLGDYKGAINFVKERIADSSDTKIMVALCNVLLKAPDMSQIDLDYVLNIAKKASKNGESDVAQELSLLARAYEAKGDKAEAVKVWTKMLESNDPAIDQSWLKRRLDDLKAEINGKK